MINSRRKSCHCYTREQAIIERETTKDPRRGWLRRKARSWASSVVLPHTQPPICSACSSDFPPVPRGVARGSINIPSNGSRSRCWFKSPCGREGERGWFVSNVTRLLLSTLSLHNLQPLTPCPVPPSLFFTFQAWRIRGIDYAKQVLWKHAFPYTDELLSGLSLRSRFLLSEKEKKKKYFQLEKKKEMSPAEKERWIKALLPRP